MASSRIVSHDDEYETQLSGFCSKDVGDTLKEIIQGTILTQIEDMKNTLLRKQTTEEEKSAVERAFNGIQNLLLEGSKAPLENLQEQLPSFLGLPPHVLLPEDEVQREQYSLEEELQEIEKLQKLKAQYKRAQYLKAVYTEELHVATQVGQQLKQVQEILTDVNSEGAQVLNQKCSQTLKQKVQDLLAIEVLEAGVRLTGQPLCAEDEVALEDAMLKKYDL